MAICDSRGRVRIRGEFLWTEWLLQQGGGYLSTPVLSLRVIDVAERAVQPGPFDHGEGWMLRPDLSEADDCPYSMPAINRLRAVLGASSNHWCIKTIVLSSQYTYISLG
ncbi:hypothetical protein AC579_1925 [Pseudocercospora musae]|uniref:Uncharacterized protein n=1 Tax=Pseudocercospora musae TaxID=113226 RepID=A0A139HFG2_9PEZI|nr:hypothetical protein AC579_1925 [Pseudocercospora musae]